MIFPADFLSAPFPRASSNDVFQDYIANSPLAMNDRAYNVGIVGVRR